MQGFGVAWLRPGFAGSPYDFRDTDYVPVPLTTSLKGNGYPQCLYYVALDRPERSHLAQPAQGDEGPHGTDPADGGRAARAASQEGTAERMGRRRLGILRGVAFRFWDEFPEHCTLPHILAFIMTVSARQLSLFLQQNLVSENGLCLSEGGRFREDQGSYLHHCVTIWPLFHRTRRSPGVLSGTISISNPIDPGKIRNFLPSATIFSKNSVYAPVIGMLMSISSWQFNTMRNKVPFGLFPGRDDSQYKETLRRCLPFPAENQAWQARSSSVEANFGNQLDGTKRRESLKYYPMMSESEEKERRFSSAESGGKHEQA